MNREPREYRLAELVEDPGLHLVMEYEGIDRRSIDLLLERVGRQERRAPHRFDSPFHG